MSHRWTGELAEYMERSKERQAGDRGFTEEELILITSGNPREWLRGLQAYKLRWVELHKDQFLEGRPVRKRTLHESPTVRGF